MYRRNDFGFFSTSICFFFVGGKSNAHVGLNTIVVTGGHNIYMKYEL